MHFEPTQPWSAVQKLIFRFFFLALTLFITPFAFVQGIPGIGYLAELFFQGFDALALLFNKWFFHITPATKPPNGNGDYPEQWMQLYSCLLLAVVGTLIWTLLDRKRADYTRLKYWLFLALRYFVIMNGISYGIFKVTCTQMPFPNLSQLATPLGDFLPMRLSWMFIGYSSTYQFFSGLIEIVAALLLLFRPTATLGVLVSLGVFINVMMLNLSYDIPVKINSMALVVVCGLLLAEELPRLLAFFFQNKAQASRIFVFPFTTKRGRIIARTVKVVFVALVIAFPTMMLLQSMGSRNDQTRQSPIPRGVYDVLLHTKGGDTLTIADADSVYWQNIVFDKAASGSIKTADKRFNQRYGRSYFSYKTDSSGQTLSLFRSGNDSVALFRFRYQMPDSNSLELTSVVPTEPYKLLLRRRSAAFPLESKPFHWISETNR